MTRYTISITSDIVCPWCYIGHARLTKAIANHQKQHPSDTFTLSYRPYYLQPPSADTIAGPSFPVPSTPRQDMYRAKFGESRARQIMAALTQASSSEGLRFKHGGHSGSSRNGHRLVWFAQRKGGQDAQDRVMLGLWSRYFEREVDITLLDVLVEVGVEAGLGREEEVRVFLEGSGGADEVDALAETAREEDGVTGVPFYVVQDTWAVSGAQEAQAFEMLFKRWKLMDGNAQVKVDLGSGDGC